MPTLNTYAEEATHLRNIDLLIEMTQHPLEEVVTVYDEVLHHLERVAAVPDFIPVFAWRMARDRLVTGSSMGG